MQMTSLEPYMMNGELMSPLQKGKTSVLLSHSGDDEWLVGIMVKYQTAFLDNRTEYTFLKFSIPKNMQDQVPFYFIKALLYFIVLLFPV